MKQFLKFEWLVVKRAFSLSFGVADVISTIIGLFGGLITYVFPNLQSYVSFGAWSIPLLIFIAFVSIRLLLAPYWLFSDKKLEKEQLDEKIRKITQSQPNIVIDQTREAPLFRDTLVSDKKVPMYHVIQVWFKNIPDFPSETSEAKHVTALIEFWNLDKSTKLFSIYGQWANSTAPNHVGFSGTISEVNLSPGNLTAKLLIALKNSGDNNCYGYAVENVSKHIDGRDPNFELLEGKYHICVKLEGVRVRKDFSLLLENPSKGNILSLNEI